MSIITRKGRVYTGPDPLYGSHQGYRGYIAADELGVHVSAHRGCEWLLILDDPWNGTWEPVEVDTLIPWHRVDSIEWETP